MSSDRQLSGKELYQRQKNLKRADGPAIICDGLQTPDNLGAILRVADAAGSSRILLLDCELDLNSKKLSRIARSSERHIQIESLELQQFTQMRHSFQALYALEITQQSQSIYERSLTPCDGILLGHESRGIRAELLSLCDANIHLPMYGVNGSMNISHALAVFLFEWRRQTGHINERP